MKKEKMVGARLPDTVMRDLEAIKRVEQADWPTARQR